MDILFAPLAQLVEQLPLKEMVPGSNPGGRTLASSILLVYSIHIARVVKLGYTPRLGRGPFGGGGSSPLPGTHTLDF